MCTPRTLEILNFTFSSPQERWNSLLFPHGIMSSHLTDAITESAPLVYQRQAGSGHASRARPSEPKPRPGGGQNREVPSTRKPYLELRKVQPFGALRKDTKQSRRMKGGLGKVLPGSLLQQLEVAVGKSKQLFGTVGTHHCQYRSVSNSKFC